MILRVCRHVTTSPAHHKSRKHLAVAFSLRNLEYTQSVIKGNLKRFGDILQQKVHEKQSFMLDNEMIRLTLDIISESAFGVNFNTMVHSNDNMGEFYMSEDDLFLKEASTVLLNPLRQLMFWNKDRQRALKARANMMELAHNLIKKHREKKQDMTNSENDNSIMGRLMSFDYETEDSRAQDFLIMLLGGHGECVRRKYMMTLYAHLYNEWCITVLCF